MTEGIAKILIDAINRTCVECHENAISHGFVVRGVKRNEAELIALEHSELSEALDGMRHGNPPSEHIPAFSAVEEELADVFIRVANHSAEYGYRLGEAIVAKMEYNATRPHKHGKKF